MQMTASRRGRFSHQFLLSCLVILKIRSQCEQVTLSHNFDCCETSRATHFWIECSA